MKDESASAYPHVSEARYSEIVAEAHELVNGDEGWRFDLAQHITTAEATYMNSENQQINEELALNVSEVLGQVANKYLGDYKGYEERFKKPLATLSDSQRAFCRQCLATAEWAPAQKMWGDEQLLRTVPTTALLMANLA